MARKSRGILRDMSKYYQDRIKSSKILEIKLLLEIFVFLTVLKCQKVSKTILTVRYLYFSPILKYFNPWEEYGSYGGPKIKISKSFWKSGLRLLWA